MSSAFFLERLAHCTRRISSFALPWSHTLSVRFRSNLRLRYHHRARLRCCQFCAKVNDFNMMRREVKQQPERRTSVRHSRGETATSARRHHADQPDHESELPRHHINRTDPTYYVKQPTSVGGVLAASEHWTVRVLIWRADQGFHSRYQSRSAFARNGHRLQDMGSSALRSGMQGMLYQLRLHAMPKRLLFSLQIWL